MSRAILLLGVALGCSDTRDAATTQPATSTDAARADSRTTAASAPTGGCKTAPARGDRTVCGRERVGPITPTTSRAALDSLFDRGLLTDGKVPIGEGETAAGTLINRGQPDSVTVVWGDTTRSRIRDLLRLGPAWRTEQGLGVGSTLQDIVSALGPRVTVLGYGWDYGGTVMLNGTILENSGIFFRTTARNADPAAFARVQGDSPFQATSADVRALDPVVHGVDVVWR